MAEFFSFLKNTLLSSHISLDFWPNKFPFVIKLDLKTVTKKQTRGSPPPGAGGGGETQHIGFQYHLRCFFFSPLTISNCISAFLNEPCTKWTDFTCVFYSILFWTRKGCVWGEGRCKMHSQTEVWLPSSVMCCNSEGGERVSETILCEIAELGGGTRPLLERNIPHTSAFTI